MNQDRAKAAEAAIKNVETLKKSLAKSNSVKGTAEKVVTPAGPTKIQPSGLPEPIAGTGFVQYIMYFIGGVLVLGVVLMIVDRWFFPIFKRTPGGTGYISLPGSDMADTFWTDLKTINDITIGTPPPPSSTSSSTPPPNPEPLYSPVLASQSTYTITLDVLINDEKPQNLAANLSRTFFFLGTGLDDIHRKVTFTMDNTKNRVHINVFSNSKVAPFSQIIQSCIIDNVPIHKPFRIGLVKTSYAMEAYLNGLLVQTVQLQGQQVDPMMGDTIYAPQNIKYTLVPAATAAATGTGAGGITGAASAAAATIRSAVAAAVSTPIVLSTGIQVMNLSLFPYAVQPNEMQARMGDLTQITTFDPKSASASVVNTVSSWWRS